MTMMLEARDLYCERDERTLFRGLSFTVEAGEWVQVTGGNGAGKTTLLRLLTGLARPDGGEVYWQGEPLRRVRDSFHRSLLWIGHQPGIKTRLTARENLHFFHPGDGARLPEALATAQGGMVILTTHQPLPGAADTVRRLALTGGGAGL